MESVTLCVCTTGVATLTILNTLLNQGQCGQCGQDDQGQGDGQVVQNSRCWSLSQFAKWINLIVLVEWAAASSPQNVELTSPVFRFPPFSLLRTLSVPGCLCLFLQLFLPVLSKEIVVFSSQFSSDYRCISDECVWACIEPLCQTDFIWFEPALSTCCRRRSCCLHI